MFQEAEITEKKENGISFTTDDLVLLIGEKVVENKFQSRVLTLQKNKIIELEAQLLKSQSQKVSTDQLASELRIQHEKTIADSQVRIKELEAQFSTMQKAKQEYAVSLENKLHEVALERDGFKKEVEELKQENKNLINIMQKRKKKVDG